MDQATGLRSLIKENKQGPRESMEGHGNNGKRIRVISVTSGKGGVGKTNIVANLAEALQKLKRRVLVLDADLG
ncbi:MAG: P-loop NTPase, partial [Desulfobacterales bacterium]|nr:P-loop NTPase [Desulfobacterales bacterium]